MARKLLFAAPLALLLGCPMPPNSAQKAQEMAQEFNVNTRFGRVEMAVEHVAPKERDTWLSHHKAWGAKIHIADVEMAGMKMVTDTEASVYVRIAWYRVDDQQLRVTTVLQKWKDVDGAFMLSDERRSDGELGLLGEAVPQEEDPAATEPRPPARFPTVRIGGDDNATFRSETN
jgi:hypothetical protein